MKAKTRNLLIGTAIAAAVGATGMAVADMGGYSADCPQGARMKQDQGGMMGGMHGGKHGGLTGGMGHGLDLSAEQKAEMDKIRQQFLPQMGELRGRMQANHEQLQALRHSGAADETAIAELADQKGALIAEMIKLRAAHQASMQAQLTDEQREQMRQHRTKKGKRMMDTPPADG